MGVGKLAIPLESSRKAPSGHADRLPIVTPISAHCGGVYKYALCANARPRGLVRFPAGTGPQGGGRRVARLAAVLVTKQRVLYALL